MNTEFLRGLGGGLLFLGLGFAIIDFFLAKLLRKIYPDENYWNEELSLPNLSPEQRRKLEQRRRLYLNGVSHRFRKWGIILFFIGGLMLAAVCILHVIR